MAFTLQDDTGTVANANAYISVADFRAYWTDKNVDTASLTDDEVQGNIVEATQFADTRYEYCGTPLNGRDQTTAFPRENLYDNFCNLVEGIPREAKTACAEYAYANETAALSNTFTASEQNVSKEMDKVDVLETEREYNGSKVSASTWNIYQIADNILTGSGFVCTAYGLRRA